MHDMGAPRFYPGFLILVNKQKKGGEKLILPDR